jgi:Ca-activated chloride channel family protein
MSPYAENKKQPWGAVVVVIAILIFGGIIVAWFLGLFCPASGPNCKEPPGVGVSSSTATLPAPTVDPTAVVIFFTTSGTIVQWINDVTDDFNAAQFKTNAGNVIHVVVTQGDTTEQKDKVLAGLITPTVWSLDDMSWVSLINDEYERRHGRILLPPNECTPIVQAAIGFGMWRPMAEAMGWPNAPIGWKEILDLANDPTGWGRYGHPEWGQFKFGHTHPVSSNAGRLALISLAYQTLGRTDGLTREMVKSPEVFEAIRQLELHTDHYGTSTRQLATRMAELGEGYLHAFTTVESTVLAQNKDRKDTHPPYVFIPPAEGTFWPDNPYCIPDADWVTDDQREAAEIYKEFLLADEQQRIAMQVHGLRSINPALDLECLICLEAGTDPRDTPQTIPTLATVSGEVADAITEVFIAAKKKALFVVVLDTSGSMEGTKIISAKEATIGFLELLAELDKDAEVYVLTFNNQVTQLTPSGRVGEVAEPLAKVITNTFAAGGTALFDAICQAADLVKQQITDTAESEQRLYGIVVLSDGKDTDGRRTKNDVFYDCLPKGEDKAVVSIPVYTIAYGADADKDLLKEIANHSYGRFYEADEADIKKVYNGIAYEQ